MKNIHKIAQIRILTNRQKAHIWYILNYMDMDKPVFIKVDGSPSYKGYYNYWTDPIQDRSIVNIWNNHGRLEPDMNKVKFAQ